MNIARNQRPRIASIMVRLCCIYWKYTGNQGWRNGRRWSRFPTKWPVFEIVVKGISELVEFVSSVLNPAPRGFRPVLTFALKTNISCFQLICSVITQLAA